jgi:hypothetical protein
VLLVRCMGQIANQLRTRYPVFLFVSSEMRSFKHTPAQTMVVFAILSKIFDLFEGAFSLVYSARFSCIQSIVFYRR